MSSDPHMSDEESRALVEAAYKQLVQRMDDLEPGPIVGPLTFEKAKALLRPYAENGDREAFHSRFDRLLEIRLMELDPAFMKAMADYYDSSEMARWCA